MTISSDSPPVKISRDRLFFDQYQYGMRLRFAHSGRMRTLDSDSIRLNVMYANRLFSTRPNNPQTISQEHLATMLEFSDRISNISVPYKRVVYSDWQYFYTNNREIFPVLRSVPGVSHVTYTEALVDRPRDTVILTHSEYSWRSYFRERMYSKDQIITLSNFILSRPQQFKCTDIWQNRLPQKWCYINRSFFVDHHSEQDTLLLNMAIPGCVRKTVPIVSRQ